MMRTALLRFNDAVEQDPAVDAWMHEHAGELGAIVLAWLEVIRKRYLLARLSVPIRQPVGITSGVPVIRKYLACVGCARRLAHPRLAPPTTRIVWRLT